MLKHSSIFSSTRLSCWVTFRVIIVRGGLDHLAAWHLPGGLVGPPAR